MKTASRNERSFGNENSLERNYVSEMNFDLEMKIRNELEMKTKNEPEMNAGNEPEMNTLVEMNHKKIVEMNKGGINYESIV